MDKPADAAPGMWPLVLVVLGLLTGATATRMAPGPPAEAVQSAVAGALPDLPGTPDSAEALLREVLGPPPQLPKTRQVDALIATLPDYVDSNSAWQFDAGLDALQRAAAADGYALYRFYLPDWPVAGDASEERRRHETEPGLVLFRRDSSAAGELSTDFVAVLIVTETPTAGVHQPALRRAATLAHALGGGASSLRVLGPHFSGSASSLRTALDVWLAETASRPPSVRIVSGSATAGSNKRVLEGSSSSTPISFEATVRTDDVTMWALHQHMARINPEWEGGRGVALLVESNTSYGTELSGVGREGGRSAAESSCTSTASNPFPCALRVPFPMHISRLRNEAAAGESAPLPRTSTTELRLRDAQPARDQLPSMRPESTSAAVDTIVGNILSTIRRERRSAIGILSTDKRDHLFLAQRIVREVPNAFLFSTEADLIYVHPDYRPYVRGMLVASTYPLFNGTQLFTSGTLGESGRQQFASMSAQGIFNAALLLLDLEERMLDYRPMQTRGGADVPPIWLSVIGQDALWPIQEVPAASPDREGYTVAVVPPAGEPEAAQGRRLVHVSRWMIALLVTVLLATAVHVGFYALDVLRGPLRPDRHRAASAGPRRSRRAAMEQRVGHTPGARVLQAPLSDEEFPHREYRLYAWACVVVLWLMVLWALGLATIWNRGAVGAGEPAYPGTWALVIVPVVWLGFEAFRTIAYRSFRELNTWITFGVALSALGIGGTAAWSYGSFLEERVWTSGTSAVLLFARTLNISSWVSPAGAILLLLFVVYMWALWNLRLVRMGGWRYRSASGLFRTLSGGESGLARELGEFLRAPWQRQHPGCLLLPTAVAVVFWMYVPFGYSPDGYEFTQFLWFGSLLVLFLIAHALGQVVQLWLLLRRIFRHLEFQPIARSFGTVAKEPFSWRLSLYPPSVLELKPVAHRAAVLARRLSLPVSAAAPVGLDSGTALASHRSAPTTVPAPAYEAAAGDVDLAARVDNEARANPSMAFLESESWALLQNLSDDVVQVLEQETRGKDGGSDDVADAVADDAHVFLGMLSTFVIRDMLSRMVSGMTVTVTAGVLVLMAHLFYSFSSRAAMLVVDWLALVSTVLVVSFLLLRLEREPILRELWSKSPGRFAWTGGFLYRVAIYGALPLVTLFAWQFPEVAGEFVGWLEPVRKAIP